MGSTTEILRAQNVDIGHLQTTRERKKGSLVAGTSNKPRPRTLESRYGLALDCANGTARASSSRERSFLSPSPKFSFYGS
jgi:hypothetical protein